MKLVRIHALTPFRRFGMLFDVTPEMVAVLEPGETAPAEAQRSITKAQYDALQKERNRNPKLPLVVADPSDAERKAAFKMAEAERIRLQADKEQRELDAVKVELENARRELASLDSQRALIEKELAEAQDRANRAEKAAKDAEAKLSKAKEDMAELEESKKRRKAQ